MTFTGSHTQETKDKIAAAGRGRTHSAEAKAKMSAARMGRPLSPEHRAQISATLSGRKCGPRSAEHRAKLAAAQRGELGNNWQGDDIRYDAAHARAGKVLPRVCAHADETCDGQLDCAFKHDTPPEFIRLNPDRGHRYSIRTEDYMRLCRSHHARYDKEARHQQPE